MCNSGLHHRLLDILDGIFAFTLQLFVQTRTNSNLFASKLRVEDIQKLKVLMIMCLSHARRYLRVSVASVAARAVPGGLACSFLILVLAHVPLQTFLDVNAIYI